MQARPPAADGEAGTPAGPRDPVFVKRIAPLLSGIVLSLGACASREAAHDVPEPRTTQGVETTPWLRDASAAWGLAVVHRNGAAGQKHLVETMGSGACLLDIEGDGDLDLYLVASARADTAPDTAAAGVMLRNDGSGFTDVSASSGTQHAGWGMGCCTADVEGDGDTDLFLTNWGPDVLFLNDGAGHFVESTDAGVAGPASGWSTAASFFDADGDEALDLLVVSYVTYDPATETRCTYPGTAVRAYCEPDVYGGAAPRLYRNLGSARFTDVSREAGIERADGKGLGAAALDVDDDGDLDLFIANDTTPNFLYVNETIPGGPIRFREDGALRGLAYDRDGKAQACMGVAVGDVDGDLREEVFVTNFARETNTLYARGAEPWYEDVTERSGLAAPSFPLLGFGTALLDADLDGDLDLLVANGHLHPEVHDFDASQSHAQPGQLFVNDGHARFVLAEVPDLARPMVGRGLVTGDVNGDGLLDVVMTQNGGAARLLLAEPSSAGGRKFAMVELRQPGANREAVGAVVELTLPDGRHVLRVVRRGDGYLGTGAPYLHAGTGTARSVEMNVRWPDGERTRDVVPCGTRVRLERTGKPATTVVTTSTFP